MTAADGSIDVVENEIMANRPQHLEPRWPAILALLAVGGLRLALPESLSAGPDWLLLAVVGLLLVPTVGPVSVDWTTSIRSSAIS